MKFRGTMIRSFYSSRQLFFLPMIVLFWCCQSSEYAEYRAKNPDWEHAEPIFQAVGNGKIKEVKALLKQGADVDVTARYGYTPLMLAAEKGHTEIVRLLLSHGANAYVTDEEFGNSPLLSAVSLGHLECVKLIIGQLDYSERGVALKRDALVLAAGTNHMHIVRFLIDQGIDVSVHSSSGSTSLHRSVLQGHSEMARWLLEHGAPAEAVVINKAQTQDDYDDNYGNSSSPFEIPFYIGRTPLELAAQDGHGEIVDVFLDQRKKAGEKGLLIDLESPLVVAAARNQRKIVTQLLEAGAKINSRSTFGLCALEAAAREGHMEMVLFLLKQGAMPMLPNSKQDKSALSLALMMEREEIAGILLSRGAVLVKNSQSERDALCTVAETSNLGLMLKLLDLGSNSSKEIGDEALRAAWFTAVKAKQVGMVELLLEKGISPDIINQDNGLTGLMWAVSRGDKKMITKLAAAGANVNASFPNGESLLYRVATQYKKKDIVETLINSGADVNVFTTVGQITALFPAAYRGDVDVVRLLLEKGADPNIRDEISGYTPLIIAAGRGNESIIKLLLLHGADPTAKDKQNKTSFTWASEKAHENILKILRKAIGDRGIITI